jgi:hypothetical protein
MLSAAWSGCQDAILRGGELREQGGRVGLVVGHGHGAVGEVVAIVGDPFVLAFDDDRGYETWERGVVGEARDDLGAALDVFVDAFDRVRRPDLLSMRSREVREREQIGACIDEHVSDDRELAGEHGVISPNCAPTCEASG